ncbi:MAG: zf-HC2 domain-containing protein [Bryobacterales bacterium]|nr:zf-HC2 domain-containing protein [Bryobacterales bacterium]
MKGTCAEIELLLCDFVDGTLPGEDRARVDLHLASCAGCASLVADAQSLTAFLGAVPDVEPPPELITRILFETQQAGSRGGQPVGSEPKTALERGLAWLHSVFEPVLQPRFAMGMAMTILSFSMIGRFAGVTEKQITAADLDPVKIWMALDLKAHRSWERAVKYYENLRVVYEIQNTLTEWTAQEEEDRRAQQVIEPKATGTLQERPEGRKDQ